jgi:hypothetical protein
MRAWKRLASAGFAGAMVRATIVLAVATAARVRAAESAGTCADVLTSSGSSAVLIDSYVTTEPAGANAVVVRELGYYLMSDGVLVTLVCSSWSLTLSGDGAVRVERVS